MKHKNRSLNKHSNLSTKGEKIGNAFHAHKLANKANDLLTSQVLVHSMSYVRKKLQLKITKSHLNFSRPAYIPSKSGLASDR